MKFAVIYQEGIHIPGHGYPESTHYYDVIKEFASEPQMLLWLKQHDGIMRSLKTRIWRFEQLRVEATISLKLSEL